MKLNIQLFASGESEVFTDSPLQMKITWESTAGTSTQNYSIVTARIWGRRTSSSTKGRQWNGYLNIGGNSHYFSEIYTSTSTSVGTSWVLMAYYTDTIYHENNGTKTITISGGLGGPSGTSLASKYAEGSVSATLDTIARNSTFNTTSWNKDTQRLINSTLSIPATQNVQNVYHKLEARFMNNGNETTICTRTGVAISDGYISFTFTTAEQQAVYNLMPSQTTHYIRMFLYTYTDSGYTNQLGDVSIVWWTGLIPSSVIPTASLTYAEGGDVPNSWGVWVKGKSKVNFTLTGTGIYGSTISAYSISGDNVTYNSSTILTNYLSTSGNITFTGVVTDTRGRTGTTTQTLSVLDYYNPSFTTTQIQRCDIDGNIDDNGDYVFYNFSGSISSCGGNNKANTTYKIGYREQNNGDYTYITIDSNEDSINASGILESSGTKITFDTAKTYDIQFAIQDTFATSTSLQTLDTGFDLMNFNESGKSMAIGKVSQANAVDELLEVALDTNFEKDVTISGELNAYTIKQNGSALQNVAISGSYTDLTDKPTIPTQTSQLTNNSNFSSMVELYSNTTGTQSVDIGESASNYNAYIISWGNDYSEKRTDIFIPDFGNNRLDQFATTGYYFIYNFTNSGNTISMSYITGTGWGDTGKMYKVIGVKF